MARIINNCIKKSVFPATWKVGRIAVIHKKKGSKTEMNNYRPVTLLCSLSKIIEKVMFRQILGHFNSYGLMDIRQYGFRPGRSCVHAVIDYLTTVLLSKEEPDENKINALLIDLSAAFDTINHEILLQKMKCFIYVYLLG